MKRVVELDAMRGLAALIIVLFHMHGNWFLGWSRVELFLVLSGFLATTIVLKQRERPGFLTTFYARRAVRIWPCYFLALLLVVALNPFMTKPFELSGLPYYALFLQNISLYWGAQPPPFSLYFQHTWTLAVLEQFYLLWPAILVCAGRRAVVVIGLLLIAFSVTARTLGLHPWVLAGRFDGLILGSLLAILMTKPGRLEHHRKKLMAGLTVFAGLGLLLLLSSPGGPAVDPRLASLIPCTGIRLLACAMVFTGLVGLLVCAAGSRWLAPLRHPWLLSLGTISYGIYLFHPLTIVVVGRALPMVGFRGPYWLEEVLKVTACILVATISYRLIERPLMSFKDRLSYAPGANTVPKPSREVIVGTSS